MYSYQLRVGHCNTWISQTIKEVRSSQDSLVDVFERIEIFFQRLEIYTAMPPTILTEMTDILIHIIVEVFSVVGLATKEIKQSRIGKYLLYKCVTAD